ncbi:SagB family peptide dehydrogenase [Roseivirga sp. BDSF3-8]|uniref:SagB family peptide dehydrogenase n=1 Tax=Roseivirga sp. BDSF3-8 TaxID=3241598 RepID=UPI003532737E
MQAHLKRSSALIFYYNDGQFTGENYVSGKLAVLSPPVLGVLDKCSDFLPYHKIIEALSHVPEAEKLIDSLLERDILVKQGSDIAAREATIDSWEWDLPARHYHARTNYVSFEANNTYVYAELDKKAREKIPPSPYYEIEGLAYINLPGPGTLPSLTLQETLLARRTCRKFSGSSISSFRFSDLLYYSFGKTGELNGGSIGDVIFKTSPSGGARHPAEIYVVVNNVEGWEAGIYHYNTKTHSLGLIEAGDFREWGVHVCSKQEWVKDASVVCILTSMLKRNMWKYENSHAYRVINMDLGHLGQTFHLVSTAMGLGPFTTAALNCKLIEDKLANDPYLQPALYACAAGWAVD